MLRLIGFLTVMVFLGMALASLANACPSVCLREGNTMCDMGCASRMGDLERHNREMDYRRSEWQKQLFAPTSAERGVIREMPGTTFQHAQPRYRYRDRSRY